MDYLVSIGRCNVVVCRPQVGCSDYEIHVEICVIILRNSESTLVPK